MLNEPYERVFKTLVTEGKGGGILYLVIPIDQELDLKESSGLAAGEKSVGDDPYQGYQDHGDISVVDAQRSGMKKDYPTVLDESANAQEKDH